MSKSFQMTAALVLVSGMIAFSQSTQVDTQLGNSNTNHFVVGPSEVVIPKGMFLLIRKGGQVGALRFTAIKPGDTIDTGKADYESYFPADGSGSFRSPTVHKQTGTNDLKPLKGIGRLAFQTGQDRVRVGIWSFHSFAPGVVSMWPYRGSQKDYGYEFAPTSAQSIEEINASDKHLKWFRFDRNSRITLQVDALPK